MGRNKELQSRLLLGYGVLYGDSLEDKPKAIRYYTESLDILSKLEGSYRNKKRMVSLYNNLGVSYHKMAEMHPEAAEGHMSEALRNFEEGLAIARGIHLTRMVGWILFNAGEIYALLGSLEKAAACSAESRRIFTETIPNDRGLSGVEMLDAVIHTQKKDHRRALDSINRSIELRQRMNEPRRLADAFEMRGDILLALGDMMGARCDYQMAHAIYNSIGSEPGSRRTGDKLAAQGGPDSAG
jgi:tetratricopeptide (TPR) repeat protein